MRRIEEAGNTASSPFGVTHTCMLIAKGDHSRIEVLRSPIVGSTDTLYRPVLDHIAAHNLVLSARETFEDRGWMYGQVEMSVYVAPTARNANYARMNA
ncbi:hypothetical protein [Mycolicibacterium neoaurum]|uniref:hypothetical protein n=1 Tax=Mycolicibacterium neoaurum TaxID=1795 RepID=UPI001F4D2796|nr:hypothetical protein [Mycolicibacterium neoaurum]